MVARSKAVFVVVAVLAACQTTVEGIPEVVPVDAAGGGKQPDAAIRADVPAACSTSGVRKQIGQACSCADECGSGFCVDGVCCDGACDGLCRACNVAGSPGLCSPIPSGMPPVVPGQCPVDPASSCGFDGTCNGAGACRKHPDGTVCAAGSCQGSAVIGTMLCAGGACRAGPTINCSPYTCNTATQKCHTTCTSAAQCDGRQCAAGMCGKKPLGATCTAAAECESNFCADGVCCNLACSGACVACNQPGRMGECGPVAAGSPDPHGVCKKEAPESCGQSGLCNGQGGCAKYTAGTICKPASCSGGSQVPASTCNGSGTCRLGAAVSCFPFVCSGSACKASCTSNADCAPGNTCTNGSCGKKLNGQSCAAASECRSNFCVEGVCCENACTGACRTCASPSARGRCVNVPAGDPDPRGSCQDKGAAMCGTNGKCNGTGGCQSYPAGTVCRPESCDSATQRYTQEGVCRNGACSVPAATTCEPFECNGARCATSCSTSDQCAAGNTCTNGSCGKKPTGALCARADECQSGFCAQGVCCGTACTASCFSCNLPGMAGTCGPVPAGGTDPAGGCKDDGPTSCGNDGTCNGQGACSKYAAGTVCAAAKCDAGTATAASTCDGAGKCAAGSSRPCNPYVCNAGGTDCFSSCLDDGQCASPNKCDGSGRCGKKPNGAPCIDGGECGSTYCTEGVCCNADCKGLCKTCALAESLGTCTDVPSGGTDPNGGCMASPESTCGNDGKCNGQGGCRKWGTSTPCRSASCPAGSSTLTKAASCDGAGTCPASETQACAPFTCEAATNTCKTTCGNDADCSTGSCAAGSCGKKALGGSCQSGAECVSGHCVDGTCCQVAACGTCQTCANMAGTCANVPADGTDPDTCSDETGTNECGTIGKCDGSGKCKLAAAGTPCQKSCAQNNTAVQSKQCDGAGSCGGGGPPRSCNGFVCTGGNCATTCTPGTNAGCANGKVCVDNRCQDA